MFLEKNLKNGAIWINIDSDDAQKNAQIYQDYAIDPETIEYALDKNERAHMDYNREDGTAVFIYNVLDLATDKSYYETIPMTFIVQSNRLITISNRDNAYVVDRMKNYTEQHEPVSVYKFLFASLEMVSNAYYPLVEQMDKRMDEVNRLLRKTTTKKHLFALSDLETSMIYLAAAAKQNRILLEHIRSHAIFRQFDELETEQFEDAMIEARQLVSMTDLLAQVLNQLSGSYNNILNNNLNANVTTLNIMEVLLGVLAFITGFFGMNVPLPFTEAELAWVYIVFGCIGAWLLLAALLRIIVNKR